MQKDAFKDRRSRPRDPGGNFPRSDWEGVALARVARHIAEIECYRPEQHELGWESAAFERLRKVLKR
jgi:hypothetical protein